MRSGAVRRGLMSVLAAGLLLAMLGGALMAWRRALPGVVSPRSATSVQRVTLEPGQAVWQTMYVPACVPRRLELTLAEPVTSSGALAIAWFALEDASRWPAVPAEEATVLLGPGDAHVSIAVPAASRVGGRLAGLRLTADRTSIVLPVAREDVVPTGYLTRRVGYVSTDDLVFQADYGGDSESDGDSVRTSTTGAAREWLTGTRCVPRTQPAAFDRPALLIAALAVMCLASAWLTGLAGRVED